jgi:hypothetical protein
MLNIPPSLMDVIDNKVNFVLDMDTYPHLYMYDEKEN